MMNPLLGALAQAAAAQEAQANQIQTGPTMNYAPRPAPVQQMQPAPSLPSGIASPASAPAGKTGIMDILKRPEVFMPLLSAIVGVAGKGGPVTAGAAGFSGGFNTGRQQAFENDLKTRELKQKEQLLTRGKGVQMVDPITGEVRKTADVGYNDEVFKGAVPAEKQSPLQNAKNKRLEAFITAHEDNNMRREQINEAIAAAQNLNGGLYGKLGRDWARNFNPDDPALQDWQKIKMILTDAQLMNVAKTKGAISDREMQLFAQAAANDDLASLPRLMPVFNKVLRAIDSEESGLAKTYQTLYGENPFDVIGVQQPGGQSGSSVPNVGGTFNGEKVRNVTRIK